VFFAILLVLLAVKAGFVMEASSRPDGRRDYFRWHAIAQRVLEGKPVANPAGRLAVGLPDSQGEATYYKLPPAFATYIAPLGLMPYGLYVPVYYVLSVAAGAAAVAAVVRMLHGRVLPGNPWLLIVPVAGVLPFAMDDLHCGNNNLLVLAPLAWGLAWASRGARALGGLAVGLAVSLKAFPLAVLAVAGAQRRWSLVLWSLAGVVLWTLVVPAAIRGPQRAWDDNVAWFDRVPGPYVTAQDQVQWSVKGSTPSNQALWATAARLLPADVAGPWASRAVVAALLAAALAGAFWSAGATGGASRLAHTCDAALASAFVLLASPIVWTYFYTLLLAPLAAGAHVALQPAGPCRRMCRWALAVSVPLTILSLWPAARWLGSLTWLGVVWYAVMLVVRRRCAI
jgi:hypothetical protein